MELAAALLEPHVLELGSGVEAPRTRLSDALVHRHQEPDLVFAAERAREGGGDVGEPAGLGERRHL